MNTPSATLLTLSDWQAAYRAGASPRELVSTHLSHCKAPPGAPRDPAWITLASEAQLDAQFAALEARAAALPQPGDAAAREAALPLYGVPFAVKDNIDIAGVPTTAACAAFAHTAERTATAVQKLLDAGAIWVGKTNLDQFATGLVGTRSPFGHPASAFDEARISGGSSSGSGTVVARGWVPFALGTDTAGSGRVPAGFNHIVGLKPTPGRVSTAGVLPACRSLDCVSVFALTVADAGTVLAVMEGADALDAYSRPVKGPARWPGKLRLGVPTAPVFFDDPATRAGYDESFERAKAHAASLGHEIVPIDFTPLHRTAALLYDGPWVAERHAVIEPLLAAQPDALDPVVRQVVSKATQFSATDAFRGQYQLKALQQANAAVWEQVDALLVPTAPGHPRFADIEADPVGVNARLGSYTNFVNLLGWSALALPFEMTAAGLPFGITLIAPGGFDAALAHVGTTWERSVAQPLGATGMRRPDLPPAIKPPAAQPTLALAVVGAHLSGLPLNWQLTERRAWLREATQTAPRYALYALPGTVPPKPGMLRVADGETGHAIEVEVWDVPLDTVGSFLAMIPPPLGLGSLELADGRWVHGFVCEGHAVAGARDISTFGGWRAYLAALKNETAKAAA